QEEVPALARAAVGRVREEVPEPAARAAQPDGPEVLVADRRREPLERRTDVGIVAPVPGQERLAQRTVPDQQALDREDGGGDVPASREAVPEGREPGGVALRLESQHERAGRRPEPAE